MQNPFNLIDVNTLPWLLRVIYKHDSELTLAEFEYLVKGLFYEGNIQEYISNYREPAF